MRRLRRPSSITMQVAIWPLPSTSFHARPLAELQTWQACCGGDFSLSQAAPSLKMSRRWLVAFPKGLLKGSGAGGRFRLVFFPPSAPLAVGGGLGARGIDI